MKPTLLLLVLCIPVVSATTIDSAFEDSLIFGSSDDAYGDQYTWSVNSQVVEQGEANTIIYASFDTTVGAESGQQIIDSDAELIPGMFSNGLRGTVTFNADDVVDLTEGSLDFYIKFLEPLSHESFSTERYVMYSQNPTTRSSFSASVSQDQEYPETSYLRFIMFNGDNWSVNASQPNAKYQDVYDGKPYHFTLTWSTARNETNLYVSGKKVARRKYDFPRLIAEGDFVIGHPSVIIDDFRIMDRFMENEEVYATYLRGMPHSRQDYILDTPLARGDTVELITDSGTDTAQAQEQRMNFSDKEFLVPYADEYTVNFDTTSSLECKYSERPMMYSQMKSTLPQNNQHTITFTPDSTIDPFPVYIKCGDDDFSLFRKIRMLPQIDDNWPKISNAFLGSSIDISEVEDLAKYDHIFVSQSNTFPYIIQKIREYNPDILITYYFNQLSIKFYGVAHFASYDFHNQYLIDDWYLKDADGNQVVIDAYGADVLNMWLGNTGFHEAYADYMRDQYIERGIFDGIWWDNYNNGLWWLTHEADYDNNGVNDDDSFIREQLGLGLNYFGPVLRSNLGENILMIGNNANLEASADYLNGKLWEGGAGRYEWGYDRMFNQDDYWGLPFWNTHARAPQVNQNMHYYGSSDRNARWGFGMSTLYTVYINIAHGQDTYREFYWLEDYWVDLITGQPTDNPQLGKGYLGSPIGEPTEIDTDVWRRDFENGIVLVNGDTSSYTVNLEHEYRYIDGNSPENQGGFTTSVNLPFQGARVLLRALCTDNPGDDPLCIGNKDTGPGDLDTNGVVNILDLWRVETLSELLLVGRNFGVEY